MSITSLSGHLTLSPGFEWIGSLPSLLAFGAAEAGSSIVLSVLAIILPFVAAAIVLIVILFAGRMLYKKFIQLT